MLAIVRKLPLMLITAAWLIGCTTGGAPHNGFVQVANERPEQASFSWRSAGLLGNMLLPSTGTDPIAGCSVYMRSFGTGEQEVTVTLGDNSWSLAFQPGPTDELWHYVVISGDGTISEVGQANMPSEPCASGIENQGRFAN